MPASPLVERRLIARHPAMACNMQVDTNKESHRAAAAAQLRRVVYRASPARTW